LIDTLVPEKLRPVINLIKSFKGKLSDWIKIFKNSEVFKFFESFSFNIKKIYDAIRDGYKYVHLVLDEISKYVANSRVVKWTDKELRKLDSYLQKNPKIKRLGGYVVAGILMYIWLNMTFLGDIEFDFDMSLITGALIGTYSLSDIFTSPSGIKMLGLLVTGTLGLSFPWSTIPQFSIAIGSAIYDLYKKKKNKMFTMKIKSNNRELIKLFSSNPKEELANKNLKSKKLFGIRIESSSPYLDQYDITLEGGKAYGESYGYTLRFDIKSDGSVKMSSKSQKSVSTSEVNSMEKEIENLIKLENLQKYEVINVSRGFD
jgi:hypothetical protein